jgi:hypothetical protein
LLRSFRSVPLLLRQKPLRDCGTTGLVAAVAVVASIAMPMAAHASG